MQRVGERSTEDGLVVVEYDIGQTVEFDIELPAGAPVDPAWSRSRRTCRNGVLAGGSVDMIVRVAVLFDAEHWSVEEVAWRRADGRRPVPGLAVMDPRQSVLF